MSQSRRRVLANAQPHRTTHAGLWLDKFYNTSVENEETKPEHVLVKQVANIHEPPNYRAFYARWEAALKNAGAQTRKATVQGRLAINLGAESVLETSIALHRTYGVPYIPGSALKGLAASFAHHYLEGEEWRKETGWAHRELFGTTEQAGCVTFFDALYVPGSGYQGKALWPDIITVHHPDYYQGKSVPPADWDSPTPIPFLTATGKYHIALAGPEDWVETAFAILAEALWREGIGAKTKSGYGRMLLDGYQPSRASQPQSQSHARPDAPPPLKPSNDWPWRKGKISKDQRYVADAEHPEKRYRINRHQILPQGYTPAGKAEVDYAVISLEDGSQSVWVKRRYYKIPE